MAAARRSTLLAFCRALPHATEDIKWGNDLIFSVGAKMFASFTNNGRDATFGCKVPQDEFAAVTAIDGISPAKYAARFHWISVDDPHVLPEAEALQFLRGSYELVKAGLSKKAQRAIDERPARAAPKKAATAKIVGR
jgi:predicted DNA-binding protein (MmcQ/YjbR family)